MTRNKVAATLVLVVSALAVWLVYFRHPDDAKSPPAPEAKAVATRPPPAKPAARERAVKTDDHGKATLAGVRPGWIEVDASAPGFATASTFTSIGTAGGRGTVTLTLRKGVAVSGRVIDESGHPLAKVKVTAGDTTS